MSALPFILSMLCEFFAILDYVDEEADTCDEEEGGDTNEGSLILLF